MARETINPDELFNSLQYGFSQIATGTGRRIVTISGQVGWDTQEQITGQDDLRAQTMKAFRNLEIAMKAAGGTLDDILSLRLYIVASVMDDTAPIREGLTTFFPASPPTTTWIGVPRLASKEFLIEIEALAVME
ncbi:MAG TPA: RidA family protein [Aggregatilinea sp.]|uniref:RidA family protein n=1 Tax=Aggregatilinea sp. TaxID=2806333 RepID=UPI002D0D8E2A|nr:RidA family protein [Aggregatilinea sp.]HML24052.1 RidA family protein [Aggregatilinea sp.]